MINTYLKKAAGWIFKAPLKHVLTVLDNVDMNETPRETNVDVLDSKRAPSQRLPKGFEGLC